MTSTDMWSAVAANTLNIGKNLIPDRIPKPSPDVAQEWGQCLRHFDYPPQVWEPAVRKWAMVLVDDRMITPRALAAAAKLVLQEWDKDPELAQQLQAWREQRSEAKLANRIEARSRLVWTTRSTQIQPETPLQRDERVARLRELGYILRGPQNPENRPPKNANATEGDSDSTKTA